MVLKKKGFFPILVKGALGGPGFFKKSTQARREKEIEITKRLGEKSVQGKLQTIATLNKNRNPAISKKASADRRFIASSFIGKRRVKTGTGLSK